MTAVSRTLSHDETDAIRALFAMEEVCAGNPAIRCPQGAMGPEALRRRLSTVMPLFD
jgi:hypothetical protein